MFLLEYITIHCRGYRVPGPTSSTLQWARSSAVRKKVFGDVNIDQWSGTRIDGYGRRVYRRHHGHLITRHIETLHLVASILAIVLADRDLV